MKWNKLKSFIVRYNGEFIRVYAEDKVGEAIAELQDENVELKQKLENVQASMYADVVDANMKNRKLRKVLYKACAHWAHTAAAFFSSYKTKDRWRKMEYKCLKKAEEFK